MYVIYMLTEYLCTLHLYVRDYLCTLCLYVTGYPFTLYRNVRECIHFKERDGKNKHFILHFTVSYRVHHIECKFLIHLWEENEIFINIGEIFYFKPCIFMKNGVFWDVNPCGSCKNRCSEELSSSFIRVTRIGEIGKTLAATSNRRRLRRN
jgi:hypothetical protein